MLLISGWYYWFKLWFCWYWKKSRYTALHLISIQNILDELKWFIYYLSPLFNFHAYLLCMIITMQMFPMITTVVQNYLTLKYERICCISNIIICNKRTRDSWWIKCIFLNLCWLRNVLQCIKYVSLFVSIPEQINETPDYNTIR